MTLSYLRKLSQGIPIIPTVGYTVETVDISFTGRHRRKLTCWELPAVFMTSTLCRDCVLRHRRGTSIWVVDSTDRKRNDDSIETFRSLSGNEEGPGDMDEVWVKFAGAI
ncbi:uncharacterized protein BT62DRAFT_1079250 [Guyanagaster necrorhizus]|uniref:Uncharacterized protein n=1 Tax=Guyanagaster necrorhizus TaxID=856835 RepID=A0A9P8AP67_9AGAR|nr:uncharacterized protein BT62DRAFT_1079250 [Guyanagaster necrorhizus MCA 3950]KAG7442654.1 hypothetical protein BT62DRAFT_1079250 [Guyanagaster necrorhizus MCA 3950]